MLTSYIAPKRAARIAALSLTFLILLATIPSAAPVQAGPPAPAAVGNSVKWDASPIIASNAYRANFPSVTVDSNNVTHIVYIMQPAQGATWQIMYTNNVGGSFNVAGKSIDTAGTNPAAVPPAVILAGPGNLLHLVYVKFNEDNQLYYRQSTDNGANWSPRVQISTGNKSAAPDIALDTAGNLHIVWINDQCGSYNVFYRFRSTTGTLSTITKPKDECSIFQNRPQITVANGKPHVVFARDSSSNGEIYYARLEGSQWVSQSISQSPGATSQNPAFASDGGSNLFAAWDENTNGNTNHEIYFKTSEDGGLTWSTVANMSNGSPGVSTQPSVEWSSTSKQAYIVWSDPSTGSQEEIWEREYNPSNRATSDAFQVSVTGGRSFWPAAGFGPKHADIAWHDNTTGNYQIYDRGGQINGVTTGCSGTLSLAGGADMTKANPVPGTITATCPTGTPDQMQISVDTQIASVTDPAPISYSQSPSIQIPAGGCEHTVYVRLFQNNVPGDIFQDKIKVDSSVNASVYAVNPNMAGLPPIYSQRITPADAYQGGASDGDPGYTRVRKFFLGVNDDADCAGLKEFSALATGEPVTEFTAGGFAGSPALPGSASPGSRTVTILVTDTLGTGQAFSTPLIYDPADTDPSEAVSNTLGLPVLDMSQNPTIAAPATTDNILVTLSFNNIHVSDNLYGDGTGPGTNDFWGVWVANSATDIATDSPLLNWVPIAVPSPGPTFSIQWSLFSGIDTASDRRAGSYFVYVRFLDGAGNPSTAVLKTQTTLSSPFTMPTIYQPVIRR